MKQPEIGQILRTERLARGWTLQQCAAAAGYENVDKGANRLVSIERGQDRFPDEEVWGRFATALGVSPDVVRAAIQADFERLESIHCEPKLIVKPFAGFYYRHDVPADVEDGNLLDFTKDFARERGVRACVVYSPVHCVYVEPDGTTFQGTRPPHMRLG